MLDYSEDNLANVGLPEAWLGCDLNDETQIENNYIKRESNQIKKTDSNRFKNRESNQVENRESYQVGNDKSNQFRHIESNQVRNKGQRVTTDYYDGASAGYLMRK